MLRVGWAVAHPLRVLAPRGAVFRSGRVRRPLACLARGRACAVGASAELVRAALLYCHQLRRVLPRHACSAPPLVALFAPYGHWRRLAGVRLTAPRLSIVRNYYRQPTPARII